MTDNFDEFVPDGEAMGDGPEAPLIPDTPECLTDVDSPVEAPVEPSAAERTASENPGREAELEALVAERTADLQRLQAEYVNYKRRVDRDRDLARASGIESVVDDLIPVLDAIEAARQHEEIDGGFKLVVDELEKIAGKYGLVAYGEVGEEFDPTIHDALMQMPYPGGPVEVVTVSAVMQKGIKLGDKVVRPARVGVANPE